MRKKMKKLKFVQTLNIIYHKSRKQNETQLKKIWFNPLQNKIH